MTKEEIECQEKGHDILRINHNNEGIFERLFSSIFGYDEICKRCGAKRQFPIFGE